MVIMFQQLKSQFRRIVPSSLSIRLYIGIVIVVCLVVSLCQIYYSPSLWLSFDANSDIPLMLEQSGRQASSSTITSLYNKSSIPQYIIRYFEWHQQQLQFLHHHNFSGNLLEPSSSPKPKFLIMRCINGDRCGGTSDRLKAFPLFIYLAYQSNRILLIRWGQQRPFSIEYFMKPTTYWNWSVPESLLEILELMDNDEVNNSATDTNMTANNIVPQRQNRVYHDGTKFHQLRQSIMDPTIWIVEGNDYSGGAHRYEKLVTNELQEKRKQQIQQDEEQNSSSHESSMIDARNNNGLQLPPIWKELRPEDAIYANFYHDLFHMSFQPSTSIANLLKGYFQEDTTSGNKNSLSLPIKLKHNNYVVAHYRAKYPGEPYRETWNATILEDRVLYAVQCAHTRIPTLPAVYVASDTALAIEAIQHHFQNQNRHIISTLRKNKNLILDHSNNNFNVWTYLDLQSENVDKTKSNFIGPASDPPHLNFAKLTDPTGFYGIFVDLFLMSYASCVIYGYGGFGRFGSLVSYQPNCGMSFTDPNGQLARCSEYNENVEKMQSQDTESSA